MHDLLARLIGENIQVSTDLAENLESINMHAAEARQIILNLALNARDAMPEGGQLMLITRNSALASFPQPDPSSTEPHIEFEVRDTGLGMDAQTRSRIFEPFFTTKGQGKWTGLGLATVLNIARQHHGTIEIDSQPEKEPASPWLYPAKNLRSPEKEHKYEQRRNGFCESASIRGHEFSHPANRR
jgi:two-component system, cell cycle sensor histidine kinase and response regulator CckA